MQVHTIVETQIKAIYQPWYNYNTTYVVSLIWKLYHGGCFNLIVSYTMVVSMYIVIPWQANSVDQQKFTMTFKDLTPPMLLQSHRTCHQIKWLLIY